MTIRHGDVFCHDLAGGGGWGDPLKRDPESVLRDVRNELVSAEAARDLYGVIVDTATWTVDAAASEARRAELRAARPAKQPTVRWLDPDGLDRASGS